MISLYITSNGISNRIELYDDEKISLTSSVQDIADVSKAKTDFTQSFTIPASDHNNTIFKHWYENAINDGYDHRIKYNGFIEIDTLPFRFGGFALNSVSFKDNLPESYNITFYGDAKSIKDIVKEDKLGILNFTSLNHDYTPTQVINRITSANTDVGYPLFAYNRFFTYGGGSDTDVTNSSGAIVWDSLFPAVRLSKIFDFINDYYGINFTGSFLLTPQFDGLYLLFRNAEAMSTIAEPKLINFTTKDAGLLDAELDLATNKIGLAIRPPSDPLQPIQVQNRSIFISIAPTTSVSYNVLIYLNGALNFVYQDLTNAQTVSIFNGDVTAQNLNDKWEVYVQSNSPLNFDATLIYNINEFNSVVTFQGYAVAQSVINNINIGSFAPDLKIIDLITGLIKMFNLVVIPNGTSYELIPLENYYINGKFNDITANVITDDIEIKKTSMYKNIEFNFTKSEARTNKRFDDNFLALRNYGYGNLKYEQIDSLESATLQIDLPFENTIYNRKEEFQFIEFMKEDGNGYVNKPLLMYNNGTQAVTPNIRIQTNSHIDIVQYRRYSNDFLNGSYSSLNWGAEISQWADEVVTDSLYKRHYENYLGAIFDIKGRMKVVKCHFEPNELTNIALNDRIILRDKRYTINKFTADLTTGDATLELLTDFRSINGTTRVTDKSVYSISADGGFIRVNLFTAGARQIEIIASADAFVKYDTDKFPSDTVIELSITANDTGNNRVGYLQGFWDDVLYKIPIIQSK